MGCVCLYVLYVSDLYVCVACVWYVSVYDVYHGVCMHEVCRYMCMCV